MKARHLAKVIAFLLSILATATVLAACGGAESVTEDDNFDLALDFYVNADHAGIFQALDEGYFDEAGLTVRTRVPSDPAAPIKQVAAGQVDLAISYEPEVMLARDQGLDVVAVGALVHGPLTSLISLPAAGIESPADLAGKTVVTAGIPYQAAYLETILGDAGVDPAGVDQVDVGFNLLPSLLSGRADAMLGGFLNVEGVQLAERGENPLVVPVDQLGIPTYDELVLVADADRVREDPGQIEAFLAALDRGTADAVADPEAATNAVVEAGDGLDPGLTLEEIRKTTARLQGDRSEPFGYMDPDEWRAFASYLHQKGQLDSVAPASDLLTNDLLPPKG